ncbi:class I SAM-dependent methyltransferase [Leifsonia sp. Root112D2]|uniref:class I SAM-dependent methyltransferase n=1 Tax=Leifsonia sp. Root112D2 TaxID=1736426 RepID=UPI0006F2635E|nr:class I SAM-dependent methyltransferase [Leifsonia sp. Root112D2]KQV06617.1 SAM-dependent methyltransferase [Leifsonia sp. Root112D2]
MDAASKDRHAHSFGAAAEAYERGRPGYPDAAVDWMLPPGATRVLDLGAGTGKLTRSLLARGLDTVAVEPLDGMRAQLERALPSATALAGSAEEIPLPVASVDAVLVAQAWHWVDPARAVPEAARVLRPGGTLGLVWNIRDESVEWVARFGELITETREHDFDAGDPTIGAPFGEAQHHEVRWTHRITRAALLDLVASRSYVIVLPEERRTALLGRVRELLDTHPDVAGRDPLPLPYITRATRARLPATAG